MPPPDQKLRARSKLRAEAAAAAFPVLDQLRERHADVADFDTVVDALVKARVQGWKDACSAARVKEKAHREEASRYTYEDAYFDEGAASGLEDLRAELRRMIRAART